LAAAPPVSAWGNAWSATLQKNVGGAKLQASIVGIHGLLDEASIPHVFIDGTLLGLYRDGVPIPQDDDVDVVVPLKDLKTAAAVLGEQIAMLEPRWHTLKVFHHAPLDIYAYYSVPEGLCLFEDSLFVNESLVWPPLLRAFPLLGNITLPIPNDTDSFLTYRYGVGWRTPSSKRVEQNVGFAEYCHAEGERLATKGMDFARRNPRSSFDIFFAFIATGGSMSLVMSPKRLNSRWPKASSMLSSTGLILWFVGWCYGCIILKYNEMITGTGHFVAPKFAILCYVIQIVLNLGVWRLWDGKFTELPSAVRKGGTGLLKYWGPAMLYALCDVLFFLVLRSMDFLTRDVLMQFRLMPLALLWQRMFGSGRCRLSHMTCIGLLFICVGRVALHRTGPVSHIGIRVLGVSAVVSTVATLLHEKLLKSQAGIIATSLQNLAMSVFGALCAFLVWTIVEASGSAPQGSHVFSAEQWEALFRYTFATTPYPLLYCGFVSFAHITRAYVLRDTSTITADVCASAGALFMTPFVSAVFHDAIAFEAPGSGLMSCGIAIYSCSAPWKQAKAEEAEVVEPEVKRKSNSEEKSKLKNVVIAAF